ncbi:hypothetical protein MD484_g8119, partial [Candolleomyces efflorescens]
MKQNFLVYFFLALSAAVCGVLALPEGGRTLAKRSPEPVEASWTNAQRLARGLPPRAPRSLYNPTRVAARHPGTSAVPQVNGYIQIKKRSNGQSLGWIKKTVDSSGRLEVTSYSDRLTVKFTPGSGPFNIELTNGSPYSYLGLSNPNDRNYLVRSNATPAGSTPSSVGNTASGLSQSAVWYYNSGSGKITATYLKTNGQSFAGNSWYGGSDLGVGSKPSGADDVDFYFVPS